MPRPHDPVPPPPLADFAADRSLELLDGEFQRLLDRIIPRLTDYLRSLETRPLQNDEGARELSRSLVEPLPERGMSVDQLLEFLFERCAHVGLNSAAPGYLGYVPGGGLPHAAVADLISGVLNRYAGIWRAAPALAQIESTVVQWLCEIVGFAQGGGLLTSGGSLASWTAVVLARSRHLGDQLHQGTMYASEQTHHCVKKSAKLAGIPGDNVRLTPTNDRFQVDVELMERRIERDREQGLRPFMVVANAGTTNTGAIDDLQAMAAMTQRQRVWLHIDAAYGGFFLLTAAGQRLLRGIEQGDSVTLDPHKGLFLPYGTGALVVRDPDWLRQVHQEDADYLPEDDPEFTDLADTSPELSRPCRGLRVWLPVKMHGIGPFRRNLEEKLALAAQLASRLEAIEEIELAAPPQLSVVVFRLRNAGADTAARNRRHLELLQKINASGRVFLSSTFLRGELVLRACVLSFRTHGEHIQRCLEEVARAVG